MGDQIMKKAYLFPGQGSQKVGMGKDHYESNNTFAGYVDEAHSVLGFDLKTIMFEGPADKLRQTEFTQPAIFLHAIALYETLDASADMLAGHSLGEFTALAAANAISFGDGLKLVHRRGELMQKAGEQNEGTMAALIGMDDEQVESICEKASRETGHEVIAANYNCPGQLVISGDVIAVKKAVEIAKEEGCRLAKILPVSGAFHSSLMQPAHKGLKKALDSIEISTPDCPIYSNYTARATEDPDEIKENLLKQLLNPVRWTQTLQNMQDDGASLFFEVGPGNVLQGLVKRTLNNVEINGYQ
jgi:[acyl-carrier-protein] S-malonyltransferase